MRNNEEFGIDAVGEEVPGLPETEAQEVYVGLSEEDIRHNMKVCIALDGIFYAGAADIMMALHPLLIWLGASNTWIGFVMGAVFLSLPGTVISPFISKKFPYKKWYMFVTHIPTILTLGILGFLLVFFPRTGMTNQWLLYFASGAILAYWFFSGFMALPHTEYIAACIPMSYRGRFTSLSIGLVGGVGAMFTALVAKRVLDHMEKPMSFGYVFLMIWVLCHGSYIFSLLGRERPTPVEKAPKAWSKGMFKAFWDDKNFVKFNILMVLNLVFMWPIINFINVYGLSPKGLGMSAGASAVMVMINQLARAGLSAPVGFLTDKLTPKRVLPYISLFGIVALLPVIFVRTPLAVYISVGLVAIYYMLYTAASSALQYGLPSPENRSGHFTLLLFINYAANTVGPILVGVMFDKVGYTPVFIGISIFGLLFVPFTKWMVASFSEDAKAYG